LHWKRTPVEVIYYSKRESRQGERLDPDHLETEQEPFGAGKEEDGMTER
jgi:hypothetical protein